ncbi:3-dehydroquinate synthase, chloroplastic [Artemisia annua]|uniref:3-dehydroquinate synthase, chloroplastic n=1 Tax=Artemisia annua TaxID=35608 RepID=A0A2U1KZA9_ARTAN|nr:3-dehydroquinate synthase, chloroplastic [Artemisia annua]
MAQVDSSVGDKTGINHQLEKKLDWRIPSAASISFRLAEDISIYGLIRDASFFEWQEKNMHTLLVPKFV